jgi:hypothetical protein
MSWGLCGAAPVFVLVGVVKQEAGEGNRETAPAPPLPPFSPMLDWLALTAASSGLRLASALWLAL